VYIYPKDLKMKKILKMALSIALLSFVAIPAQADFLLGSDIEANAWMPNMKVDGNVLSHDIAYTLQGTLEHPIPLFPNFLGSYSTMNEKKLKYTKIDALAYYEILDNSLVSVDVGLGVTALDFSHIKTNTINIDNATSYLPAAYAAVELGIPSTPLFIYAKTFLSGSHKNTVIDGSVGIQYEIDLVLMKLELQGGYRVQDYQFNNLENNKFNAQLGGFFAGVNLDF